MSKLLPGYLSHPPIETVIHVSQQMGNLNPAQYTIISNDDVLVIDEARVLGTRQLARVTAKTDEIGAPDPEMSVELMAMLSGQL